MSTEIDEVWVKNMTTHVVEKICKYEQANNFTKQYKNVIINYKSPDNEYIKTFINHAQSRNLYTSISHDVLAEKIQKMKAYITSFSIKKRDIDSFMKDLVKNIAYRLYRIIENTAQIRIIMVPICELVYTMLAKGIRENWACKNLICRISVPNDGFFELNEFYGIFRCDMRCKYSPFTKNLLLQMDGTLTIDEPIRRHQTLRNWVK